MSKFIRLKLIYGTFFLSFGLLVYEILCTRMLVIVVGPSLVIFVIALAMLGISTATSFMTLSSWPPKDIPRLSELSWTSIILGITYLLVIFFLTLFNHYSNTLIDSSLGMGEIKFLVSSFQSNLFARIFICGFLLFLPYLVYGIAISVLFRSTPAEYFHKIYFADLFGAATGCFASVVAFQNGGFHNVLALILLSAFLAAVIYDPSELRVKSFFALLLCFLSLTISYSGSLIRYFEPKPNLNLLARNWNKKHHVHEIWHTWNSYSRVSLLSLGVNSKHTTNYVYALANGDGWAWVPNFSPNRDFTHKGSIAHFASLFNPRSVLVMFAGIGNDMLQIDDITKGKTNITGVELNSQMIANALKEFPFRLSRFYNKPNINLVVSEGREYLEQNSKKYDSILLSWSGASIAYYVGTCGQTTQYLYTKEAFKSLLDHLTTKGILIISNTSKAQDLLIFRSIFAERGWKNLSDSVIIFRKIGLKKNTAWYCGWDLNHLMISRSPFTKKRLDKIQKTASQNGYEIILAPGYTHPGYQPYREIIEGSNPEILLKKLEKEKGVEFSVITDDRPFPLDFTPRSLIFTPHLWFSSVGLNKMSLVWRTTKALFFIFLIFIFILSLFLILGPLFVNTGLPLNFRNINHLFYFFSIGMGFMLVEVGMVQKFSLLLGNPYYSIAVILATLILSSGIGSYHSNRLYNAKILNFCKNIIFLIIYLLLLIIAYETFVKYILPLQILYKVMLVIIFIFPLGFLMGQLFPQGLIKVEKENKKLIPWAWAINGAASTIAVGLGFLLSQPLGFDFIIYTGAAFYSLVLIQPIYRSS